LREPFAPSKILKRVPFQCKDFPRLFFVARFAASSCSLSFLLIRHVRTVFACSHCGEQNFLPPYVYSIPQLRF